MYPILLAVHNIVRWVALILAIIATTLAVIGWLGKKDWTPRDRKIGVFYTSAMDLQLLLGLLLYFFFSPLTTSAFGDLGAAMGNDLQRFFTVEHVFFMLLAIVFAHLGSAFSKRADEPVKKHRVAALWFGLSLILLLLGMPWMRSLLPRF
jgi:hypothetical protein